MKRLAQTGIACFVILFTSHALYRVALRDSRPTIPTPDQGLVQPVQDKVVFYVTEGELSILTILFWGWLASLVVVLITALVGAKKRE